MKKQWLEFCKKYNEKLKNDTILSGRRVFDYIERKYARSISFRLQSIDTGYTHSSETLFFTLDKEDLKYLYTKYSNKLNEELALEKQKLDEEYKAAVELYTEPDADKQE